MTGVFTRQDFIMNTTVEQRLDGDDAEAIAAEAVVRLRRLEGLMSFFLADSDVSRLNQNPGTTIAIQPETAQVLSGARTYAELSESAFDVTAAPVVDLWRTHGRRQVIPSQAEIEDKLALVGYEHLSVSDQTAALAEPGCAVDLGGIAKGFAADVCIGFYRDHGVESGFINLGGNVRTIGTNANRKDWRIGLQHPDQPRGALFGAVVAPDQAIVTSGGYERGFTVGDHHYHHIIDPRTGWPANSGLTSVTAICENSMAADALATAGYVLGLDDGLALIRSQSAQAVFVTTDKDVYITSGLRDNFILANQVGFNCYLTQG